MANQFKNLAKEVLLSSPIPLTYKEIWDKAVSDGIDKKLKTDGKTPWQSLGAQVFIDVRDNPTSEFVKVGSRPARFFLKSRIGEIRNIDFEKIEQEKETIQLKKQPNYSERDLHPIIAYFTYSHIGFNHGKRIVSKTIFHEKSKKGGYNERVYPDLVGFYLPLEDRDSEIIELNRISDNSVLRLYSFEVKRFITRSNYRESYFQAVSNSSWAHEGYLIAAKINDDEDLLSELERLNQSFGIGIIEIDIQDINSSRILFQAVPKKSLDWETMNKLCESNPDFKKFVEDVKIDLESKRIHLAEYDTIEENIEGYVKKILKS